MLDRLPSLVRETLWHCRHRALAWFARKGFAESLEALLEMQLKAARATVALDVGANRGQYARLLRRVGYRGRIVSFEPVAENVEVLHRYAARDPLWEVVQMALGDEDSLLPFNVTDDNVLSSFLHPSAYSKTWFKGATIRRTDLIRVRRLDAVLTDVVRDPSAENIHLKVDTQGFDLRVMRGCQKQLQHIRSLQMEVSFAAMYDQQQNYLDALLELERMGFRLTGFFPMMRDERLCMVEADILLRRDPDR